MFEQINSGIPKIETLSPEAIRAYQDERLVELIDYLNQHSKFYQGVFRTNSINTASIRNLDDLTKIPTTTKEDLQTQNEDFICVPKHKLVDYTTTSGTLGHPLTFALTERDLERLAYNEYISFMAAGCTANDVFQLMTTIDRRFMAGLAYFLGVRKLGAGIVRVGGGLPELQWDTILKMKPSVLITVPSFLLRMIEFAREKNINFQASSVRKAICIGEPIRMENFDLNTLGKKITEQWPIELFSTYASTEMATAFTECVHGCGGHHPPELVFVELLGEANNPVGEGEPGEVTISTLGVEGMPLLRFKTGDVCQWHQSSCACGRNTLRLGPVLGRKKQMIKYKGTTLYPAALYDVLEGIEQVGEYVVEVFTNEVGTDEILIKVAGSAQNELEETIKDRMRTKLRVAPNVLFESPEKILHQKFPKMSRKPVKFFDKR